MPPLLPAHGPVSVYLIGEAPGPRGADKSGYPFFGDAAGRHLYRALRDVGAVILPPAIDELPWDGATFAAGKIRPHAQGIALGNAFDRCPTDDGVRFRAPSRGELEGENNVARLVREFTVARARGLQAVVTLGRVATRTIDAVFTHTPMPGLTRHAPCHIHPRRDCCRWRPIVARGLVWPTCKRYWKPTWRESSGLDVRRRLDVDPDMPRRRTDSTRCR